MNLYRLHKLLSVVEWTYTLQLRELPVEVGQVIESTLVGDISYRKVRFHQ